MAWRQQDFILRMIEQVAAAIARAVGRGKIGETAEALEELQAAEAEVLGPAAVLAGQVDVESAVNIVGDARRLALWAQLLWARAEVLAEVGEVESAEGLREKARVVAKGALRRDDGVRELVKDRLE